jgi:Programmed cell death protein 2, C-terminal putative domain
MSSRRVANLLATEPWVVGYAAPAFISQGYAPDWRETRLGGAPAWPPGTPSGLCLPQCSHCDRLQVLVLQAYAPTFVHPERALYMFACNSIRCASNPVAWSVLRLVVVPRDSRNDEMPRKLAATAVQLPNLPVPLMISGLSSSDRDDSSDDNEDIEALLRLQNVQIAGRVQASRKLAASQKAQATSCICTDSSSSATSLGVSTSPGPVSNPNVRWLQSVRIEVDYEPELPPVDTEADANVQRLLRNYMASQGNAGDGDDHVGGMLSVAEEDEPESAAVFADHCFRDQMLRVPGHVVRYKRGATPLWPSYPAPENPAPCPCGSRRVFEMQILSTSLHYLKVDEAVPEEQTEAGMNWAAAAAYTCENDCITTDGMLSQLSVAAMWEHVSMQPDDY